MKAKRRALLVALFGAVLPGALSAPALYAAAASTPQRRIGLLFGGSRQDAADWIRELAEPLRKLGWTRDRLAFEIRATDDDSSRNDAMAAELVRLRVDLLMTGGTPRTRALQQATRTIPIVTTLADPVASGFARSIAAPGGNVTGIAYAAPAEVYEKQMQFLKRVAPSIRRVAHFFARGYGVSQDLSAPVAAAAARLGLAYESRPIAGLDDFARGFGALRGDGAGFLGNFGPEATPAEIASLAIKNRVPTMFNDAGFVEAGGLMAYFVYLPDQMERTASIVDRILRGATPARIPFEMATKSMLEINRATARAIGLRFPEDILVQADRVIG